MTMHDGHRKRMRERFRKDGLDGFAAHEVLELLLFYGRARGDVNPLAHELLDAFGSLKGVLEARPEQLMAVKGVGEESATLISLMLPMFRRYTASLWMERPVINHRSEASEYCKALLAGWRTEHFYVLCLNSNGELIGQRKVAEGSLAEVTAYPRLVIETALNYNARSVVLCHNHPSGNPTPSTDDITTTLRLQRMLSELDVTVLDHIIVAGDQAYSMAQHGELSKDVLYRSVGLTPGSLAKPQVNRTRTKGKELSEA